MNIIEVDPTDLKPGDIVMRLTDHDISGCHCDVRVLVARSEVTEQIGDAITDAGFGGFTYVPPGVKVEDLRERNIVS